MIELRQWLSLRGRTVLWATDAQVAYAAAFVSAVTCSTWAPARDAAVDPRVLGAIGAIGLAVLSVSLGAVALMAGLLDETFSYVIARAGSDQNTGIDDALQPYRAMAVIGALTIGSAMLGIIVTLAVTNWVVAAVTATLVVLFGTWSVAGTTQLVFLTAFFAGKKGQLLATRADANVVQMRQGKPSNSGPEGDHPRTGSGGAGR